MDLGVSIHAPARGATMRPHCPATSSRLFQSTRPHGARQAPAVGASEPADVSIHAPARGATPLSRGRMPVCLVSIHAPARGATFPALICSPDSWMFQSTRPHGARQRAWRRSPPGHRCFNPRARTGRDGLTGLQAHDDVGVSIHAPARGATSGHGVILSADVVSIHAPARGATRAMRSMDHPCTVSIHAPARGATAAACQGRWRGGVSIHAPARGATAAGGTQRQP